MRKDQIQKSSLLIGLLFLAIVTTVDASASQPGGRGISLIAMQNGVQVTSIPAGSTSFQVVAKGLTSTDMSSAPVLNSLNAGIYSKDTSPYSTQNLNGATCVKNGTTWDCSWTYKVG